MKIKKLNSQSLLTMMIIWVMMFILPILFLFGLSNNIIMSRMQEQFDISSHQILKPYINKIDVTQSLIRKYVATKSINTALFEKTRSDDSFIKYSAISEVQSDFSSDINVYETIDSIFFFTDGNLKFVSNSNREYEEEFAASEAIKKFLIEYKTDKNLFSDSFLVIEDRGKYFLLTAVEYENYIWGCWLNIENFLQDITGEEIKGLKHLMFVSPDGKIFNSGFSEYKLEEIESSFLSEYFIVTEEAVENDFKLMALIDANEILLPFSSIRVLMAFLFILSFAFFTVYLFFLRNKLIKPMKNMNTIIEKTGKGNFEKIEIPDNISDEFKNTYNAINTMTDEIKKLKIDMYEEKINKQNIQSQLLQLQIKPHFFLNSLNIILSFARKNQYDMVKKMTICLASHFRYILYRENLVPLEKEIEHIENYLMIQGIRYEKEYTYSIKVDDDLNNIPIPVLTIQTFVENALKYADPMGNAINLIITVKNAVIDMDNYILISVKDDGKGFSNEMLDELNNGGNPSKKGNSGIGIYNLKCRLSEIYEGHERLLFSNNPDGGANIQIFLPKDDSMGQRG